MANKYVRTDGLDPNSGDADTAGAAWLTVRKAVITVASGDTTNIGAGTYSEDGGLARFHSNVSFASATIFQATNPLSRPLIRGASLATYSATHTGRFCTYKNVIFGANPAINAGAGPSVGNFLINNETADDCVFDGVDFDLSMVSGTPTNLLCNFSGTLANLSLLDVAFKPPSVQANGSAASFKDVTNGLTNFVGLRITSTSPRWQAENIRSGSITDSSFRCNHGAPLTIGKDGDSGGMPTQLNLTNIAVGGGNGVTHACLLAHGAADVIINRLYVDLSWSNTTTGDYGLVNKSTAQASANQLLNSVLYAGAAAGKAALYHKGGKGLTTTDTLLIADGVNRKCLFYAKNDALVTVSHNTHRRVTFRARNGASVFSIAAADDGGNNVFEKCIYDLDATSTFGSIGGVTLNTIDDVRTATNDPGASLATSRPTRFGFGLGIGL